MKPASLPILVLFLVAGCISAPIHDPALAVEKVQRQRLVALRDAYNHAEDAIDQALVSGTLPVADVVRLRDELQGRVRPLIEIAQQSLGTPDFDRKCSDAEHALANVGQQPATTQPVLPTGSFRA